MINLKNNKGAITLYILASLLFFVIAIVNVQTHLKTKEASIESEYQKIKASYEKDVNQVYHNMGSEIEKLRISGQEISKDKVILKDANEDTIVIPKGFKVAPDSAILVKEGIVVVAPDGSEFVWVPVEDINELYETRIDKNNNEVKIGKIYEFQTDGTITPIIWSDTGRREPDILYNSGNSIDDGQYNITKETLQEEFDEMIKYVGENNGFYVGRYETSLDDLGNAQSKKNVLSATMDNENSKMWYGLYNVQKNYIEKSELSNVKGLIGSNMIWGSQYNKMMFWMMENNYNMTLEIPKNGVEYNKTKTTGIENDKDVINNVFDLIGCNHELTMEASYTMYRVSRRR